MLEALEQEINSAFATLPLTSPHQAPESPVINSLRDDEGLGPAFVLLAQDLLGKLRTITKTCETTQQVRFACKSERAVDFPQWRSLDIILDARSAGPNGAFGDTASTGIGPPTIRVCSSPC